MSLGVWASGALGVYLLRLCPLLPTFSALSAPCSLYPSLLNMGYAAYLNPQDDRPAAIPYTTYIPRQLSDDSG